MQTKRMLWIIVLSIIATVSAAAQAPEKGPIVRLDPALDDIVPSNAKVEKVVGDIGFAEGPLWVRKGGYLIFSDIANNVIDKWNPADGKLLAFLDRPDAAFAVSSGSMLGGSNGITMDREGRIVYCTRTGHQVMRLEKDGKRTELASQYDGKRLNAGCNDIVYKSDGSLYFTDPRFGIKERKERGLPDAKWELPYLGVYLLKDGKLQLLTKEVVSPNGIAFTPDEKQLYVVDDNKKRIMRFDVQPDDTITNGQVFIDMSTSTAEGPGGPDSMKVDKKGNVYCPGPGGLWIMSPAGKHLGTLVFPEQTSNLAFGDADGKTAYVTAQKGIYKIRLKVAGIRP
jgi:gluconolactonase